MILGAVLAGGKSTRFGSDKALALFDHVRLIDHAITALNAQCDAVVIVGRQHGHVPHVDDWQGISQGPLGGVMSALRYAAAHNYSEVLSCGVDAPALPGDLASRLSPAPAFIEDQPVIGLWPVGAFGAAKQLLDHGRRSMRGFAEAIDARPVHLAVAPANINTPDDLARLELRHGF